MHDKNPFREDYNFDNLVQAYPKLKEFVFTNKYDNQTIKFSDSKAVLALNSAILKDAYKIEWDLPFGFLCPPIPGRLDYLLHINDLIQKPQARILDIGTGANLIYPILANCHFNWHCSATEIEAKAVHHAQTIIEKNEALKTIDLRQQLDKDFIFKNVIKPEDKFDVAICNPPFFSSPEEAYKSNNRKRKNLKLGKGNSKNFGGKSNELWCEGGEVTFIKKMIEESIHYAYQVQWFTTLVSRKENLHKLSKAVNKTEPADMKIVDMAQGNKMSRFLAWTFQ